MNKEFEKSAFLKEIKNLFRKSKCRLVSIDEIDEKYIEYYKSDKNLIYKLNKIQDKLDDTIHYIEKNLTNDFGGKLIEQLKDSVDDIKEIIHFKRK